MLIGGASADLGRVANMQSTLRSIHAEEEIIEEEPDEPRRNIAHAVGISQSAAAGAQAAQ